MKKKLIYAIVAFFLIANFCFGQDKIGKYCKVQFDYTFFGKKITTGLGSLDIKFKDSTVDKNLLALKKLKNEVDVLDYMHKFGWELISSSNYRGYKEFYFRKIFDKSEITIDDNNN